MLKIFNFISRKFAKLVSNLWAQNPRIHLVAHLENFVIAGQHTDPRY